MFKPFIELPQKDEQILVGLLWKDASNYRKLKNHKISEKTFVNKVDYVFYKIGKLMYDNNVNNFDKLTVYSFLDKRKELLDEFELAGGYKYISDIVSCLDSDKIYNIDHHVNEVLKFESLRTLYEIGFISKENKTNLKRLVSLSIDELRSYLNHHINKSLAQINSTNYEIYDIIDADGFKETIESAKKGIQGTIQLRSKNLNRILKGWQLGKLYYLVMPSGLGKSTIARNLFLPSIIENKENTLIFVNEENLETWRLNLLVTIANLKIEGRYLIKDNIMSGKINEFDEETLNMASQWLIDNANDFILKLIVLKSYRFEDILKVLEEHRAYNITSMILDTFKPSTGKKQDIERWQQFSENSQELFDLIKTDSMNIRCLTTLQLKLGYQSRYLTLDAVGKSKETVEVADVVMLGRELFKDEMPKGKNELPVYNWKKDEKTGEYKKESVILKDDKRYLILFFGKNRCGTDREQVILEMNYDKNLIYDVGFTEMRPEG